MQNITIETIKHYNPCKSGLNNALKYYPKFNGDIIDLLCLENISYSDKIWVACKIVDYKILQKWAVLCAESQIENYNKIYPNDNRITNCIETTKKYLMGENFNLSTLSAARSAESAA